MRQPIWKMTSPTSGGSYKGLAASPTCVYSQCISTSALQMDSWIRQLQCQLTPPRFSSWERHVRLVLALLWQAKRFPSDQKSCTSMEKEGEKPAATDLCPRCSRKGWVTGASPALSAYTFRPGAISPRLLRVKQKCSAILQSLFRGLTDFNMC